MTAATERLPLEAEVDPDPGIRENGEPVQKYLSRADVATYLGLKSVRSLSRARLPRHDVEVGVHKGWLPETIDQWDQNRPGKGNWGAR